MDECKTKTVSLYFKDVALALDVHIYMRLHWKKEQRESLLREAVEENLKDMEKVAE